MARVDIYYTDDRETFKKKENCDEDDQDVEVCMKAAEPPIKKHFHRLHREEV